MIKAIIRKIKSFYEIRALTEEINIYKSTCDNMDKTHLYCQRLLIWHKVFRLETLKAMKWFSLKIDSADVNKISNEALKTVFSDRLIFDRIAANLTPQELEGLVITKKNESPKS